MLCSISVISTEVDSELVSAVVGSSNSSKSSKHRKVSKHSNSSSPSRDSKGKNNEEKQEAGPSRFAPGRKAGKPSDGAETSSGKHGRRLDSKGKNDLHKQAVGLSKLGLRRRAGQPGDAAEQGKHQQAATATPALKTTTDNLTEANRQLANVTGWQEKLRLQGEAALQPKLCVKLDGLWFIVGEAKWRENKQMQRRTSLNKYTWLLSQAADQLEERRTGFRKQLKAEQLEQL